MGLTRAMRKALAGYKRWNIFTGDTVQVIGGRRDVGRQGKVVDVVRDKTNPGVIIEGLNIVKRAVPNQEVPNRRERRKKGIVLPPDEKNPPKFVTVEQPIHYSNVALLDPVTKQPCRVKWMSVEEDDGSVSRVRVSMGKQATRSIIELPPDMEEEEVKSKLLSKGPLDTEAADVFARTYVEGEIPDVCQRLDVRVRKLAERRAQQAAAQADGAQ
ncbi:unnamed protein product [Pedinophyceae sp. YPF-701]|nr:unnamed protein product [Pedinophyceae sp. YPF-701]